MVKGAEYEGELPENAELYIHNTEPTALIDLAMGGVMKDPYGKPGTIKCRKVIEIVANDIAKLGLLVQEF